MTEFKSLGAMGWAKVVGAAALGLIMMAQVAIDGGSAYFVKRGDPATALWLTPNSAAAQSALAELRLGEGDFRQAAYLARRALVQEPLNVVALRTLGLAAEAAGREDDAFAPLVLAGRLSWRDTQTHLWLFREAMLTGQYGPGMQSADALLRRSRMNEIIEPVLVASTQVPEARAALVARLADRPKWRGEFLARAADAGPALDVSLISLFDDLRRTSAPPSPGEAANLMHKLVDRQSYTQAVNLWRRLSGISETRDPVIFDGSFSRPPRFDAAYWESPPFEWRFIQSGGATVDITAPDVPHDGAALLAEHSSAEGLEVASQIVVMRPGSHRLRMMLLPAQENAASRIRAWITCMPANARIGELRIGGLPVNVWTEASIRFVVPAEGCPAQQLHLGFAETDRRAPLTVWFDDVVISR